MDRWGANLYGDPCRECGFEWSADDEATRAILATYPADLFALLGDASGGERHPGLTWSVGDYVCHVADNLRIFAERIGGALEGAGAAVGPYDQDLLAEARNYAEIPLGTALRSLRIGIAEYLKTIDQAPADGVLLVHPERGELTRSDVIHANVHDALHHLWDIRRTLSR